MSCLRTRPPPSPPTTAATSAAASPATTASTSAAASPSINGGGVPSATAPSAGLSSPITLNLTQAYAHAVHTASYTEIRDKIQTCHVLFGGGDGGHVLADLLHPGRDAVDDALRRIGAARRLAGLVSAYFDNSEQASRLCLDLHACVAQARSLYRPISDLADLFPDDSPAASPQLEWAFQLLTDFERFDNPFPAPGTAGTDFGNARRCFSELKRQLDRRLRAARRSVWLLKQSAKCSTICLIGTVLGVVASGVVIAVHALPAIAAAAAAVTVLRVPNSFNRRRLDEHIAQLDAAAKGTYVLNNDLDTIGRLVARLHEAVEGDKRLVRLGLARGKERYPIQGVVEELRKNMHGLVDQLVDLEEHVFLCFATVNRARSLLLQEINNLDQSQPHYC